MPVFLYPSLLYPSFFPSRAAIAHPLSFSSSSISSANFWLRSSNLILLPLESLTLFLALCLCQRRISISQDQWTEDVYLPTYKTQSRILVLEGGKTGCRWMTARCRPISRISQSLQRRGSVVAEKNVSSWEATCFHSREGVECREEAPRSYP